jgi:integrase
MIPGHEHLSAPPGILVEWFSAITPLPARVSAVAADVVDAHGLGARAAEVAARQRSPQTRRTYASVYRSLLAFLGEHATVDDLTPDAVRTYRDALEHADRTPATIAKHLSAIRGLAAAIGADADVRTVRSASVARGEPRALSHEEFARLLKMPDRRTRQGKRDLALLHLLGSSGLRPPKPLRSYSPTSTSVAARRTCGCAMRSRARHRGG